MSLPTEYDIRVAGHDVVALRLYANRTEVRISTADARRIARQLASAVQTGEEIVVDLDADNELLIAPAEAQRFRIELDRAAKEAAR